MSTCECCGHTKNGYQHGAVCSLCEDTLAAIKNLPGQRRLHVLTRAAGATPAEIMQALGCASSTNSSALDSAKRSVGCDSIQYLIMVARYGIATKRLPLPEGFERPDYVTPTHDTTAPRIQPRPEIPVPPSGPVVIEHREPEAKAEPCDIEQAHIEQEESVERTGTAAATDMQSATIKGLLAKFRAEAQDAGMDYQCAFAELAHLVLTGEGLPDMKLVQLAYQFGAAKGRVEALEALE